MACSDCGEGVSGQVLGIAGPPGSGKSTLVARLVGWLDATCVAFDEFETMTQRPPGVVRDWVARGAPLHEVTAPGFAEAIAAARRQGGLVVVEAPLGRAWPPTAGSFDWCAWIDCPWDIALARKAAVLLAQPGPAEGRLIALTRFMTTYPTLVRPTLAVQATELPEACDAILDGTAPDWVVFDAAQAALKRARL